VGITSLLWGLSLSLNNSTFTQKILLFFPPLSLSLSTTQVTASNPSPFLPYAVPSSLFHGCRARWDRSCGIWSSTWLSLPGLCVRIGTFTHMSKNALPFLCVCVCVCVCVCLCCGGAVPLPTEKKTHENTTAAASLSLLHSLSLFLCPCTSILSHSLPSPILVLKGAVTQ